MRMDFDAQDFAVGYRSVAVAAGKSVDPSISRNVLFEVYPPGVRLVAFDGQMLTVSWVSRRDAINGEPSVEGLLFGAYWNLDENTPVDRPDPSSDDDPDGSEFLEGVDELIDMLDTVAVGS